MYAEEDLLMISGIQHYAFCRRQWALIHIEQQWGENVHTVRGENLHEKVDNPFIHETRKDYFISRSLPLVSYRIGFYGVADVAEFHKDENGVYIPEKRDYYTAFPVEYKAGKPKKDDKDAVQLCVQAICLEEMLGIKIEQAYLFYWKTRRRELVELNKKLREEVYRLAEEMHEAFREAKNFPSEKSEKCNHCSMYNVCLPKMKSGHLSVKAYIDMKIREGDI